MSIRKSSAFQAPVGDLLDPEGLGGESLERVGRRVAATRRVPPKRDRRIVALAVAAALVLVVIGTTVGWPGGASTQPLETAAGERLISIEGETHLSDGSTIISASGVALEVIENTGTRLLLVQGNGRVAYQVTPGGTRQWSIDAGAVTVDVTGTRFVVERDDARVRVSVQRGRVRVRGEGVPGGLRSLGPGDVQEVSDANAASLGAPIVELAPERASHAAAAPPETAGALVSPEPNPEPAGASSSGRVRGSPPSSTPHWLELARASNHAGAFRELGPDGIRRASSEAASVEELLQLADVARAGERPELAVAPLRRIVEQHAAHPRAAWAALTLGRLHLDQLSEPAEAAASLERALDLGLGPRLRETALARLVDAYERAGQPTRAVLIRAQYEGEFPNGRYFTPIEDDPR